MAYQQKTTAVQGKVCAFPTWLCCLSRTSWGLFTHLCDMFHHSIIYEHGIIVCPILSKAFLHSVYRLLCPPLCRCADFMLKNDWGWDHFMCCEAKRSKRDFIKSETCCFKSSRDESFPRSLFSSLSEKRKNYIRTFFFLVFLSLFRNSVMFNNELMADVHFVVGQPGRTQRLPGHRVRISLSSKVTAARRKWRNKLSGPVSPLSDRHEWESCSLSAVIEAKSFVLCSHFRTMCRFWDSPQLFM